MTLFFINLKARSRKKTDLFAWTGGMNCYLFYTNVVYTNVLFPELLCLLARILSHLTVVYWNHMHHSFDIYNVRNIDIFHDAYYVNITLSVMFISRARRNSRRNALVAWKRCRWMWRNQRASKRRIKRWRRLYQRDKVRIS